MKKVLVLVAGICLLAAPAFALSSIVTSLHDLSNTTGGSAAFKSTNVASDEVCVFCHTPHGGNAVSAPLWNRTMPAALAVGNLYNSATLDLANSVPTAVLAKVNASDAKLCLSCHDGAKVAGALTNVSNSDGAPTFGAGANFTGGFADIANNTLTDDHPIGMDYAAVQLADATGFNVVPGADPVQFFDGGVMWCSSCHDVHDDTATPFLVKDNGGSALCTTCHAK